MSLLHTCLCYFSPELDKSAFISFFVAVSVIYAFGWAATRDDLANLVVRRIVPDFLNKNELMQIQGGTADFSFCPSCTHRKLTATGILLAVFGITFTLI